MALDAPLSIETRVGKSPDTVILTLSGPVTLRNLFDLQAQLRKGDLPAVSILDLSGVPYMDSAGMGAIVNYYVRCQNKGIKLFVAGVSPRVLELFKMTRVDAVMNIVPSVDEAESKI